MPQSKAEDRTALLKLHALISGAHTGLHTIQILTVDPEGGSLARGPDEGPSLVWLLLSSRTEEYQKAVQGFTQYKRSAGQADRTLAFDDCREPTGEWVEWDPDPLSRQPGPSKLEFSKVDFGQVQEGGSDEDLKSRLHQWEKNLGHEFADGGSSLWLTIRHRLKGLDETILSSIFLVFDKIVTNEKRPEIAHIVREFLFDRVLHFYERQIEKQHEDIENSIRRYLSEDPRDMLMAHSTVREVSRLKPLLAASIPIMIEGERGTGKLNLALHLLRARQELDGLGPRRAANRGEPLIVNCAYLSGQRDEIFSWFKKNGLITDDGALSDELHRDIVFDDVHLGSRIAQQLIYRLVSSRLGWDAGAEKQQNGRHDRTWVILTVGPSIETAIHQGAVISELGLLAAFKISLPTLHDRLGQVAAEDRLSEFRKIVDYLGRRAQNVMPNRPRFEVAEEQLLRWMSLPWRENYWGLKQNILHHVINSNIGEGIGD